MLERLDTLIAFATIMLGVSLLITIINQMVASLLGHRATYLKDGIKDLLETLDPKLIPYLEKIATDVLTHKLASDSVFAHQAWAPTRWKLANAVRPEELAKLLKLVSTGQPYEAQIEAILNQVNPTVARDAQLLAGTVNTLAPGATASADQLLKQLTDKATNAIGRLEAGFNSTMDRVRQRFTLQMRIWSIVFALVFALAYHLDALKIYTQLSTDPTLRASLSNASENLLKNYSDVNNCQKSLAPNPAATPSATQQPGATQPAAQNATAPSPAPATSETPTQNGSAPSDNAKLDCDVKNLASSYKEIRDQLSNPKLALFEVPKNWDDFGGWGGLLRILATAGLLSLGAPFWYNVLKNLVNLRSQVSEQQQKEEAKS